MDTMSSYFSEVHKGRQPVFIFMHTQKSGSKFRQLQSVSVTTGRRTLSAGNALKGNPGERHFIAVTTAADCLQRGLAARQGARNGLGTVGSSTSSSVKCPRVRVRKQGLL